MSPYVDAVFSLFDWLVSLVEAHIPLSEWLTFRVTFNSTTSSTLYNSTTHKRFVEGGWEYREEAYRLITDDIDIGLSCDFVAGVLRVMEKVELGVDASNEVAELEEQYGREVCTEALVGVSGTFSHNSTHNTTLQKVTLVAEPGWLVRSLPGLLGFALHCSLNHALQANSVPPVIFASIQLSETIVFIDLECSATTMPSETLRLQRTMRATVALALAENDVTGARVKLTGLCYLALIVFHCLLLDCLAVT